MKRSHSATDSPERANMLHCGFCVTINSESELCSVVLVLVAVVVVLVAVVIVLVAVVVVLVGVVGARVRVCVSPALISLFLPFPWFAKW